MAKKPTTATAPLISKMKGRYDGAELRPYDGRPGAMDAFSKPSLFNGVRTEHKPMIGMASSVVPFFGAKSK